MGFDETQLPEARAQIFAVAKEFEQGAVFEYGRSEVGDQFLTRTTVPVLAKESAEEVCMVRISPLAGIGNDLLERPWAGPQNIDI